MPYNDFICAKSGKHFRNIESWENCQKIYDCPNLKECPILPRLTIEKQPKTKSETPFKANLTLDEKLDMLFIMLSNDKSIKFRKKEWIKKRDQVREALKSKGTASKLGECPNCKLKSVLANSDASGGWCINPECDYMIGYIKPFRPSNKHWY